MVAVEFNFDPRVYAETMRIQQRFPKIVDNAINSSLVRAAQAAHKNVVSRVAAVVSIRRTDLYTPHRQQGKSRKLPMIDIVRPVGRNATAGVSISERRIPLSFFKAKEQRRKRTRWRERKKGSGVLMLRKGGGTVSVSYEIRRGQRHTLINIPGPIERSEAVFMGRARRGQAASAEQAASGHMGVWMRAAGRKRLPITQLYGPSIARVVLDDSRFAGGLRYDLSETFNKRMRHELQFRVARELFPSSYRMTG